MKPKYCLPIIKNSKEEVLKIISENPEYDFYEIWLAYIKDLDTDFTWNISDKYNGKLVFLFRRQDLEKSEIEKDLKEKIIKLLETSDNLLDLDIRDQEEELEFVKKERLGNKQSLPLRVKLIVSYHNYKETPDSEKLDRIINKMMEYKPEIYKISTFCNSKEDALILLKVLLDFDSKKVKKIILGMGENGLITRIFGTLWGNEIIFAPIDEKEKSAPGQITKEKFERILNLMKDLDPVSSTG